MKYKKFRKSKNNVELCKIKTYKHKCNNKENKNKIEKSFVNDKTS